MMLSVLCTRTFIQTQSAKLGIKEHFSLNFDRYDLSFWVIMGQGG